MSIPAFDTGPFRAGGRFQPLAKLGRGAMGVVYRVLDTETDTEVALKTLAVADPEQLYRLKQEFRVLSDLAHPNLVELYELISEDGDSYFTMEFVDGVDFVRALRDRGDGRESASARASFEEAVATAAAQLASGVAALHASGRLHRDIKPSNVLVAADGRVVLLDFGLATAFGSDTARHYGAGLTGTYAYMAPEVLLGAPPSPEADWYSVGALLHETLTDELPIDVTYRGGDPLRDGAGASLAAPWKETLGLLLAPQPERRLDAAERLLHGSGRAAGARRGGAGARIFVGREAELETLRSAFDECRSGIGRVVHVTGSSGIGKSELLRRFLGELDGDAPLPAGLDARGVVVLAGRCHPQESVPYKAFDSLVDSLSRALLADAALAAACVPADTGALKRLFPVLERVPALMEAKSTVDTNDPMEIRRLGFEAFRTLLASLAARVTLVCWIDDLQWSDLDSLLLLRELLREPALPLLVLLSYRSEDAATSELAGHVAAIELETPTRRIELGPLQQMEGAALLRGTGHADLDTALGDLVADTEGSPFLLSQVIRSLEEGRTLPRMADIVAERIVDLTEPARMLLEIVSVAGGPLTRSVALDATGLGARGRLIASNLEKRSLLRTTSLGDSVGIEIYHDRIREALLATLPVEAKRHRHAMIADVIERQPEPDPEALFRHNLGADRRDPARRWAEIAGDRASAKLAFGRAIELFEEALRLRDASEPGWPLMEKRADALANSGQTLDAARTYEEAGRELAGLGTGSDRRVLSLRQRAATHYLQTGHLDQGLAVTREVLANVGIHYPRTQSTALLSSLWQRARLGRRGLAYTLRDDPLPENRQLKLDACWSAGITLDTIDPVASDSVSVQHALEALDSGDFVHITRAIGGEAARCSQLGGAFIRRRCARLARIMEDLVQHRRVPVLVAQLHSVRGMIAFQAARWFKANEEFSQSSVILRRDCVGVTWEMATIETFGLSALAHMGELRRLGTLLPISIGNATDRGDLYASLLFRTGVLNLVWLARDEGEEALAVAEEAMARWPSSERFQVPHYVHLIAAIHADLYRGDPWSALRRIETAWPRLKAAFFLHFESARVELRNLRARAALAAAVSTPIAANAAAPDARWPRERLLGLVANEAVQLARIDSVVSARPLASLLEAGVFAARGRTGEAAAAYRDAAQKLRVVEMGLYAAAAGDRAGAWIGGAEGEALRAAAREWAAAESIVNTERMFAVTAPG